MRRNLVGKKPPQQAKILHTGSNQRLFRSDINPDAYAKSEREAWGFTDGQYYQMLFDRFDPDYNPADADFLVVCGAVSTARAFVRTGATTFYPPTPSTYTDIGSRPYGKYRYAIGVQDGDLSGLTSYAHDVTQVGNNFSLNWEEGQSAPQATLAAPAPPAEETRDYYRIRIKLDYMDGDAVLAVQAGGQTIREFTYNSSVLREEYAIYVRTGGGPIEVTLTLNGYGTAELRYFVIDEADDPNGGTRQMDLTGADNQHWKISNVSKPEYPARIRLAIRGEVMIDGALETVYASRVINQYASDYGRAQYDNQFASLFGSTLRPQSIYPRIEEDYDNLYWWHNNVVVLDMNTQYESLRYSNPDLPPTIDGFDGPTGKPDIFLTYDIPQEGDSDRVLPDLWSPLLSTQDAIAQGLYTENDLLMHENNVKMMFASALVSMPTFDGDFSETFALEYPFRREVSNSENGEHQYFESSDDWYINLGNKPVEPNGFTLEALGIIAQATTFSEALDSADGNVQLTSGTPSFWGARGWIELIREPDSGRQDLRDNAAVLLSDYTDFGDEGLYNNLGAANVATNVVVRNVLSIAEAGQNIDWDFAEVQLETIAQPPHWHLGLCSVVSIN